MHELIEHADHINELLRQTMDHVNTGGHNVILTPGRYNAGLGKFTVNIRIIRLNVGADFLVLVREKNSSISALVMSSSRGQWILCLAASLSTAQTV